LIPVEMKYRGKVKCTGLLPTIGFDMDDIGPEENANTTWISITVLSVTPMRAGKLFALAPVELDIDGLAIEIHGIRPPRVPPGATKIERPNYRDAAARLRAAIVPQEVRGPIGDSVLARLVELGLAVRRSRKGA
jgi:hypothetical protein